MLIHVTRFRICFAYRFRICFASLFRIFNVSRYRLSYVSRFRISYASTDTNHLFFKNFLFSRKQNAACIIHQHMLHALYTHIYCMLYDTSILSTISDTSVCSIHQIYCIMHTPIYNILAEGPGVALRKKNLKK